MPDDLRAVLNDMDDWIAARAAKSIRALAEADVIKWRAALATALERLDKVEQASRSAVDAFLLRPPSSDSRSSSSTRSTAGSRQKYMSRLATAMATLERELAPARSGEGSSPRHDTPTGSAA
jgi:hypothetical protein